MKGYFQRLKANLVTLIKFIKRTICKYKGHNFETYLFSTGYWSNDIEQAGLCKRCEFDTHEGLEEYKH